MFKDEEKYYENDFNRSVVTAQLLLSRRFSASNFTILDPDNCVQGIILARSALEVMVCLQVSARLEEL